MDGIAKGEPPPPPIDSNVYELTVEEKIKKGIGNMPGSLGEALEALKSDEVIKSALEPLTPKFIRVKSEEWREYSYRVHEWERQRYLEENFTIMPEFRETGERMLI